MANKQQRFIITCAARTGSTMLRVILDRHPDLICYGEVVTLNGKPNLGKYAAKLGKSREQLGELLAADPIGFLYHYVWGDDGAAAIGCKIKYKQFLIEFPALFEAVLADKSIRIVHLMRRNLLKRYVSNRLAASQLTPTVVVDKGGEVAAAQQKITIDVDDCVRDIEKTQQTQSEFRNRFADHPVFEVFYEDLTAPGSQELLKLQAFLGVKPKPIPAKTVKLNSDNLADIIENYHDVRHMLGGTVYAGYL